MSTVSGIIEGSGSLGAAIIQKIIPYIESEIFILLAILCFSGGLIVSPIAYHEFKRKAEKSKNSLLRSADDHSLKNQLKELDESSPPPALLTLKA